MALRCEVLLFAQLAQAMSTDRLTIELPDDATVAVCMDQLAAQHEGFGPWRHCTAVAVNERYVTAERALTDGDVIALIPPVSGG